MQEDLLKDETLSISEAAQYIGVHPETLRRWETAGLLTPTFRTSGNQRRYLISDLDNLKSGKNAQDKTDLILDQITTLQNQNEEIRHLVSNSLSSFANAPTFSQPVPSVVERTSHFRPSEIATEHKRGQHAHPAFSAVILSLVLLLVLLASLASFFFVSPSSFKSSLLNPLSSFLLSGGARVEGTMRFLSTIFFGESDEWFISPLGDAHFRNLTASQITASSVTTDYLTVTRSETIAGLNADFLDGQDGSYYLAWENTTGKPVILSSLDNVSNNEGNIDLIAAGNITITPNDSTNTITLTVPATPQGSGSGLNADLLDSLDSSQFLRSDTSDSFSSGTLTFSSGTTLSLASGSTLSVSGSFTADSLTTNSLTTNSLSSGTILPLADDAYDLGSSSLRWRDLYLGPTSLHIIGTAAETTTARDWRLAIQETDGTTEGNLRIIEGTSGTEALNITPAGNVGIGVTDPTARLQLSTGTATTIGTIIKGASSQSADLLQLKSSLDAVLARVDALGNIVSTGTVQGTQLISTVGTGTAPLSVASTTVVPNLNAASAQQPNPNLILNSDFSRRNKWMTFMPEVFTDTSGWTLVGGSAVGNVASNILTAGNVTTGWWRIYAGLSTWRDGRWSAQVQRTGATDIWSLIKSPSNTVDQSNGADAVEARINGNGTFDLIKRINSSQTTLKTVAQSYTGSKWYWLELEAQGTTYIAKLYSCSAVSDPCAKSTATLLQTLTDTVSDSFGCGGASCPGGAGYIQLASNQSGTKWGGLSTGDGGVYVEGWGPESWTVSYIGAVKGGEAIGFDETVDAGPIGKQWALKYYIPTANRRLQIMYTSPDGSVSPSTAYTASTYLKMTGTTTVADVTFNLMDSALNAVETKFLQDNGETTWARKTAAFTGHADARRFRSTIDSSAVAGTGFVMLPQLEQGSVATPWRNAPADDDPIPLRKRLRRHINPWVSSETDIEPRDLGVNFFCPWDCNLKIELNVPAALPAGDNLYIKASVDGVVYNAAGGTRAVAFQQVTGASNNGTLNMVAMVPLSAGKHRIAGRYNDDVAGNGTIYGYSDQYGASMLLTAYRGKGSSWNENENDLAEEYSVTDSTIEAGDVVRTSGGWGSLGSATVERVDKAYDPSILGIISTYPAITFGNYDSVTGKIIDTSANRYLTETDRRPVALSGRVPVKVTNENGSIKRGDFLTSSATYPGYATKATRAGRTIGIALESFGLDQVTQLPSYPVTGKILVFVNLSWYDPDAYLSDTGQFVIAKKNVEVGDGKLDNEVGSEKVDEETGDEAVDNPPSSLQPQSEAVPASQFSLLTSSGETIERIGAYNSLFVANLRAGSIDASQITLSGTDLGERIKSLETKEEGILEQVKALVETMIQNLTAKTAQITEAVIGRARINKLEMVDQSTGKVYCTWIADGEWQKEEGECPSESSSENVLK